MRGVIAMGSRHYWIAIVMLALACGSDDGDDGRSDGQSDGGGEEAGAPDGGPRCLNEHQQKRPGGVLECGGFLCVDGIGCYDTCEDVSQCREGYECAQSVGGGVCVVPVPD